MIYIAIPHMGELRAELVYNLLDWRVDKRVKLGFFPYIKPIAVNRNIMIEQFLASDCNYLMMIDSDQSIHGDFFAWEKYDLDIIGALCGIIKGNEIITTALDRVVIEGREWQPNDGYKPEKIEDGELKEVDVTGSGCLMIHRRVLEKMKSPWFEYPLDKAGRPIMGNDFYFCEKAKKLGFKVFVDANVKSSHYCKVDLTGLIYG